MSDNVDFLNGFEGAGFEDMSASTMSVPYLAMVQVSSEYDTEEHPAGSWMNTATNEGYGTDVSVVVLGFRTIWSERERVHPYRTVGRYPVMGIPVEEQLPAPGTRGFKKLINPKTGNEIQELFVYAVILPEHPDAGVMYFSPTISSMRALKAWNSKMRGQRLPNGKTAPLFGYVWRLTSTLVQNPKQPKSQMAVLSTTSKVDLLPEDLFNTLVKPCMESSRQALIEYTDIQSPSEDTQVSKETSAIPC